VVNTHPAILFRVAFTWCQRLHYFFTEER